MFCYDIETLDTESTAVVLSIAMVYFGNIDELIEQGADTTDKMFDALAEQACYVKLSVDEQVKNKRSISKDTVEWWGKQAKEIRQKQLTPSAHDVSVAEARSIIGAYMKKYGYDENSKVPIWARGSLDQVVSESLFKENKFTHFGNWRDVRTAVELIAKESRGGYCKVPGLDINKVNKHDPIHDCCLDIMMLEFCETR